MTNPLYPNDTGQLNRVSGALGVRDDEKGRTPFRKDYGRLLHSASFRRLQGKTQLFPGTESDFFRNRLTHSLEVAQIARGIVASLNARKDGVTKAFPRGQISQDLVEFAGIAHDLGHPPFGHNGEEALDSLMRDNGGFEGNAQTLRILTALERKLCNPTLKSENHNHGLDLTYRSLASILKYDHKIDEDRPKASKVQKGYYCWDEELVREIKKRVAPGLHPKVKFKTIECAIMDLADDIAYSTYDLEDSLHAEFTTPGRMVYTLYDQPQVRQAVARKVNATLAKAGYERLGRSEILEVIQQVFDFKSLDVMDRDEALGRLSLRKDAKNRDQVVSLAITAYTTQADNAYTRQTARTILTANRIGRLIDAIEFEPNYDFPALSRVKLQRESLLEIEVLKHLNFEIIIRSPRLAVVEHRGKKLIEEIFNALRNSGGSLLPIDWKGQYDQIEKQGLRAYEKKSRHLRLYCDFIACMTDRYAVEYHSRLLDEGLSIFKPL